MKPKATLITTGDSGSRTRGRPILTIPKKAKLKDEQERAANLPKQEPSVFGPKGKPKA
jgi:hypothetical protein